VITPLIGLLTLILVTIVALSERESPKLGFFDAHAAIVVFGGVFGSLLLAIEARSLGRMILSVTELVPGTSATARELSRTQQGLARMREAWRDGRRSTILEMADKGETPELRVAADALLRQVEGPGLEEAFSGLRTGYLHRFGPIVEGWEMVARLAPSFGMVGTVTGMVQLFRHMSDNTGNLGGSIAMALLATLYGISMGAALGGPMASRVNNQLNDRLALVDHLEKTVAALVREARGAKVAGGAT
jgi:chemotaxis protein MotA